MFRRLWTDEAGAVVALEYLLLGSAVTAGAAVGVGAMKDAVVGEYRQFGQEVREVRRQQVPVAPKAEEKRETRTGEVGL